MVCIGSLKGKKLEHHGIRVEFVGQIEMFYDRGNHHDFLSLVRQLDPLESCHKPSHTSLSFHKWRNHTRHTLALMLD